MKPGERGAAVGHGLVVAVALAVLTLALLLAAAGLVLGARWLWRSYHDLALALSFLGALVLGISILWRGVEVLAVHYRATRDDRVSPATHARLRREVER